VVYDWQYGGNAFTPKVGASPPGPVWLRKFLGDEYFQEVVQLNLPASLQFGPDIDDFPPGKWREAQKAFEDKFVKPLVDDQLACLEPFDRLKSLVIWQSYPLKGKGLARLETLSHLKELFVCQNFEGDDLSRLGALTNLEILTFQTDFRRKTDVQFLVKLSKLQRLVLGGVKTTDEHLAMIGRLPRLEAFTTAGPELTDAGIAHLEGLKSLKSLFIMLAGKLTNEGLAHLESLSNLEDLSLSGLAINNVGLGHLRKLPKLKKLSITRGDLDDATLDEFKKARPGVAITFWR
jgi:hypothetical protein